jgi:hypothetical protein
MINDPRQMPQGNHPTNPQHPPQRPTAYPPPPRPVGAPPPQVRTPMSAPTPVGLNDADLEPISLVEEALDAAPVAHGAPAPKKIVAFGADVAHVNQKQWKRPLHSTGTGATRVKSFHGKYSEQGLEYLDNAINAWLDGNTDVEVKFVTSTVMTFEGKIREPALVLNVWY